MPSLTIVSGGGAKGPACFVVDTGGARLMLDLGYGPQPGLWPDVSGVGKVDALLLSHSHRDHAGGMKLRAQIGEPPVYATDTVRRRLPADHTQHSLPLQGTTTIAGVSVTTGRSGHAPGGVWLHLAIGGGLLYMGDNSVESALYAHDAPPRADVAILDCSYGDYAVTLSDRADEFAQHYTAGPVLLPIPPAGRGPEIALHAAQTQRALPAIDDALRDSLRALVTTDRDCLRSGIAPELERLANDCPAIDAPDRVMLAGIADGTAGASALLLERWRWDAVPAFVFTGYLPPGTPAQTLTDSGRARYLRWNVHPRLADNVQLVRDTGARTIVPAFGDASRYRAAWKTAFAPARVHLEDPLTF
ncbi:MAG: MBL fold metallo-hydrolase [Burkholderiales bacterium]